MWRGTCMPSMPAGASEDGEGSVVGDEGADEGRAENETGFAGGESDPPEWDVGSTAPVPGTTAIRFAPPPESIERSVVGFVDAYDLYVRCVGAYDAFEVEFVCEWLAMELGASDVGEIGRTDASVSAPETMLIPLAPSGRSSSRPPDADVLADGALWLRVLRLALRPPTSRSGTA